MRLRSVVLVGAMLVGAWAGCIEERADDALSWLVVAGDPTSVLVESTARMSGTPRVLATPMDEGLLLSIEDSEGPFRLRVNMTYLESHGIVRPGVERVDGTFVFARLSFEKDFLVIPDVHGPVHVVSNATLTILESRMLMGVLAFGDNGFKVVVPLVSEYWANGFGLQLTGIPWNDPSLGYTLGAVNLTLGGVEVAGRNETHYTSGIRAVEPVAVFHVQTDDDQVADLAVLFRDGGGTVRATYPLATQGPGSLFVPEAHVAGDGTWGSCPTTVSVGVRTFEAFDPRITADNIVWGARGWHQDITIDDGCGGQPLLLDATAGFVVRARTNVIGRTFEPWFMPLLFGGSSSEDFAMGVVGTVSVGTPLLLVEVPQKVEGEATVPFRSHSLHWAMADCPRFVGSLSGYQDVLDLLPMGQNHTLAKTDCLAHPSSWHVLGTNETPEARALALPVTSTSLLHPMRPLIIWEPDGPNGDHIMKTGWKMMTTVNHAFTACPSDAGCAPYNRADVYMLHLDDTPFHLTFGD